MKLQNGKGDADRFPNSHLMTSSFLPYGPRVMTDEWVYSFLKIIPAIIQSEINKRSLPFLHAEMGAASETQLEFAFSTVLKAPGSMSARMDAL